MIDTNKLNSYIARTRPLVALGLLILSGAASCKALAPALVGIVALPVPPFSFIDLAALAAVLWTGLQATR